MIATKEDINRCIYGYKTYLRVALMAENLRVLPKDIAYGSAPRAERQVLNSPKAKNSGK